MLLGFVAIPFLIKGLGAERFALLTLIWMITGYFGFFDFGLSRALTQTVAEKLASGKSEELPRLISSVTWLLTILGALAGVLMWSLAPYAINHWIKIPEALKAESESAAFFVAMALPWIVGSAALKGVLEGAHRFDYANILRVPLSSSLYVFPALLVPWLPGLQPVVFIILIIRFLGFWGHWYYCRKIFPSLRLFAGYDASLVRPLYHFGFWMTVSNLISPIMSQMDRFYVGAVVNLEAVAYYATPYELINKLYALPMAITSVLFPTMTAAYADDVKSLDERQVLNGRDASQTQALYFSGFKFLFVAVFPLILTCFLFAQEGLSLWLGPKFGVESARVLQIFCLGIFLNAMANVPFNLLQAGGRPDLTAKIHLLELPVFIGLLYFLTRKAGIEGTAWAWTLRMGLDLCLLIITAHLRVLKVTIFSSWGFWFFKILGVLVSFAVLTFLALELNWIWKIGVWIIILAAFLVSSYRYLLNAKERLSMNQILRKRMSL